MALFDKTTITAAVDTGPRASRTDVDKLFLAAIVADIEKGLFSSLSNTQPELFWDTSRRAFAWGQGGATAPDLYLQRQSSSVLELMNAGNSARQGLHVGNMDLDGYQDIAEITTPANPAADHARLYSKDDGGTTKLYFRDSVGAETPLGSVSALNDLTDVTVTGVTIGEVLGYSAGWINRTLAEAGIAAASHVHAAADVTSGTFAVARGGTGLASLAASSYMRGNGTSAVTMRTFAQVLSDIGAAAASHNHAASAITSGILAVAQGGTGVSGDTYDADKLDGVHGNAAHNTFSDGYVRRHSSGYIYANFFNQSIASVTTDAVTHVPVTRASDGFYRFMTTANFKAQFSVNVVAPVQKANVNSSLGAFTWSSWTTLDLGTTCPAGASAALIFVGHTDVVGGMFQLREGGGTGEAQGTGGDTSVALDHADGQPRGGFFIVPVDASGDIQYRYGNSNGSTQNQGIEVWCLGYVA